MKVAIASVVTAPFLPEFMIMKASFELFHGNAWPWFVRGDAKSAEALATHSNIRCTVFDSPSAVRPQTGSSEFRKIVAEKMNAVEEAWSWPDCEAVVFLDADLVITAEFLPRVLEIDADLILTPHYRPVRAAADDAVYGHFNSGFVLTREPAFHDRWRRAFTSNANLFTDQGCLSEVATGFKTATLGESANIGIWRRTDVLSFLPIPPDCIFLHVHLFHSLDDWYGFLHRAFAVHCVRFLNASGNPEHGKVLAYILDSDRTGWYSAALRAGRRFAHASER